MLACVSLAATLGALSFGTAGCAAGPASPVWPTDPAAGRHAPTAPARLIAEPSPKAKVAWLPDKSLAPIQTTLEPPLQGDALILATTARCPAEMALIEGQVCIDRWEASLVERTPYGERAWSPFLSVEGNERRVRAVSQPGVIPQGYISGQQAALACTASGKRLCAPSEWEQACRGPSRATFPYGERRRYGACNDDGRAVHPVSEIGALLDIQHDDLWRSAMNNPLINQLQSSLLPTGERASCTNAYEVFDMVGNLHEWVDDAAGTFRGGYYMDTERNGDGCSYATRAHDFSYHDYSTGFRCCMDPERVE
ncbi:Cell division protein FtsK [Chondromyces apiculatus DSM 436]|uniref:Cell division protein FtsK n=1 Tax=Chondromyces apiculatus DSM 436 TaxID=1192034 RepID=A0A017TDL4_9BACT|nr:Cell division protein FtsK [Chondromyces apiculatus DSM 436]